MFRWGWIAVLLWLLVAVQPGFAKVDVSWNPAWVGKEQVRTFKIDGDRLQQISDWMPAVTKPEKGMGRGIVTLERVK